MEKITPFIIVIILLPVEILGSILTLIYQTIKHMDSIIDLDGAKIGFKHGMDLDREFWHFIKNYLISLKP